MSNDSIGRDNLKYLKRSNYKDRVIFDHNDSILMTKDSMYLMNLDSIYRSATKKSKLMWKKDALRSVTSLKNTYDINNKILHQLDKDLNKHKIYWWEKITLSLGCIIFLLVGAPLGSIVKRGGLGYPIIISVATFILYYIFETSGSKMASEGVWKIWFGSWLSTMILAPLGLFFTYQANRDSGILKNDAIKNFLMTLFAISEKRNITVKEVVIDNPDYEMCCVELGEIYTAAHRYKANNALKKIPSVKKVFFTSKDDALYELNEKLENIVEVLGNSRNSRIIARINDLPVLSVRPILAPFKRKWMNCILLLVLPISILVYARAIRFRIKLLKDLIRIEIRTREIIKIIKKEKLIDIENERV